MCARLRDLTDAELRRRGDRVLREDELDLMFRQCGDLRQQALFEFLRTTGCRVSEALAVTRADIDFNGPMVSFPKTKGKVRRSADGGTTVDIEPRETPLALFDDRAVGILRTYVRERNIRPERKLFPVSSRTVRYTIGVLAERAGLRDFADVHPHTLRHSAATHLLENGFSPVEIKHMLGWSQRSRTFETTYAHPTTEGLIRKSMLLRRRRIAEDKEAGGPPPPTIPSA